MEKENWIAAKFWDFLKRTAVISLFGIHFFYAGVRLNHELPPIKSPTEVIPAAVGMYLGTWIVTIGIYLFVYLLWNTSSFLSKYLSQRLIRLINAEKRKRDFNRLYEGFDTEDTSEDAIEENKLEMKA